MQVFTGRWTIIPRELKVKETYQDMRYAIVHCESTLAYLDCSEFYFNQPGPGCPPKKSLLLIRNRLPNTALRRARDDVYKLSNPHSPLLHRLTSLAWRHPHLHRPRIISPRDFVSLGHCCLILRLPRRFIYRMTPHGAPRYRIVRRI